MDTVTHALFGALVSRVVTNNSGRKNGSLSHYIPLMVTSVAAVFPDSDYFLFLIDPLEFLAEWHRSFTHSFVLLPVWTILLSVLTLALFRGLKKHIFAISGFIALGLASHIMLDLLTVYGTRIFYPLSSHSFSFGTTFIIDPYLSLIVIVGLIISFFRAPRSTAVIFMIIFCVYILFQWRLKSEAHMAGVDWFSQSDVADTNIVALPQPFSPFHWRIIHHENGQYSTALIDLIGFSENLKRQEGRIPFIEYVSVYHDINHAKWEEYTLYGNQPDQQSLAREVWRHKGMTHFRNFAVYPILYRIDHDEKLTCVWFSDLRYHMSIMTPSFRYGMCREDDPQWQRYRLKYFTHNNRSLLD